jgi:hypothetical protein
VHHDHPMDLASFSKREYNVGRMAVVFYRKHPGIDDMLQVRWVADWADAVDRLAAQPALLDKLRTIDAHTDTFFTAMAASLEDLLALEASAGDGVMPAAMPTERIRPTLNGVLALIFDVQRTRGKVHEWYAGVNDPVKLDAAKALLGWVRKLDFLNAQPGELMNLPGPMSQVNRDVVASLRARASDLEQELGIGALRRPGERKMSGSRVKSLLRRAQPAAARRGLLRAGDAEAARRRPLRAVSARAQPVTAASGLAPAEPRAAC